MHFLDCGGNELPDKKSLLSIAKKTLGRHSFDFPNVCLFKKFLSVGGRY